MSLQKSFPKIDLYRWSSIVPFWHIYKEQFLCYLKLLKSRYKVPFGFYSLNGTIHARCIPRHIPKAHSVPLTPLLKRHILALTWIVQMQHEWFTGLHRCPIIVLHMLSTHMLHEQWHQHMLLKNTNLCYYSSVAQNEGRLSLTTSS